MYLYRIVAPMAILAVLFFCVTCDNSSAEQPPAAGEFSNPEAVTIIGYENEKDNAMEPFISRDGKFLFFNTDDSVGGKDIYFASFNDATTFTLVSELGNVNSAVVDGVPTMDSSNRFYYISTAAYDNAAKFDTIYTGTFDSINKEVDNIKSVPGIADDVPYHINFDVDISPDGKTMYFVDGVYNTSWIPTEANIAIAVDNGSGFKIDPQSDLIFKNINTDKLEYAPCISSDGLELFFTRFDGKNFGIYRSMRSKSGDSFGTPQKINAITGFVEGPALSPDERSLYYHKKVDDKQFVIYRVTR